MKNKMQFLVLLFICCFFFVDCKIKKEADGKIVTEPTENLEPTSSDCSDSKKANVENFTGLSGCGYLLQLEDGTYVNPLKITDDRFSHSSFSDASEVMITFKKIPRAMTNCMKGKNVEITCMEILKKGKPKKAEF